MGQHDFLYFLKHSGVSRTSRSTHDRCAMQCTICYRAVQWEISATACMKVNVACEVNRQTASDGVVECIRIDMDLVSRYIGNLDIGYQSAVPIDHTELCLVFRYSRNEGKSFLFRIAVEVEVAVVQCVVPLECYTLSISHTDTHKLSRLAIKQIVIVISPYTPYSVVETWHNLCINISSCKSEYT